MFCTSSDSEINSKYIQTLGIKSTDMEQMMFAQYTNGSIMQNKYAAKWGDFQIFSNKCFHILKMFFHVRSMQHTPTHHFPCKKPVKHTNKKKQGKLSWVTDYEPLH